MDVYEFLAAQSYVSHQGGPYIDQQRLTSWLPEDAEEALRPILEPYGQDPAWYFEKLGGGRPPAPWAMACMPREYRIAGHIVATRPPDSGILLSPYEQVSSPIPDDFVPSVGVVTFQGKGGLESAAGASPVFQAVWQALENRPETRRWLVLIDPPDEDWLRESEARDRELWFEVRGKGSPGASPRG